VLGDSRARGRGAVVNRLADPPVHAIVPIDRCYELVGMIKAELGGISGGDAVAERGRGVLRACPAQSAAGAAARPSVARAIAPEFRVHDVTWVPRCGAPTLSFARRVTRLRARGLHDRAHRADQHRPARRSYDDDTREALEELFGPPERWAATTKSFVWSQVGTLVPSFTGETTFTLPMPCTYDLELAAAKYLYNVPDGEVPLSFHFTGSVLHRGDAGQVAGGADPLDLLGDCACRSRPGGR
jgi:hypothetical protein